MFALIGQNVTAQANGYSVTHACSTEIQTAACSGSSSSRSPGTTSRSPGTTASRVETPRIRNNYYITSRLWKYFPYTNFRVLRFLKVLIVQNRPTLQMNSSCSKQIFLEMQSQILNVRDHVYKWKRNKSFLLPNSRILISFAYVSGFTLRRINCHEARVICCTQLVFLSYRAIEHQTNI